MRTILSEIGDCSAIFDIDAMGVEIIFKDKTLSSSAHIDFVDFLSFMQRMINSEVEVSAVSKIEKVVNAQNIKGTMLIEYKTDSQKLSSRFIINGRQQANYNVYCDINDFKEVMLNLVNSVDDLNSLYGRKLFIGGKKNLSPSKMHDSIKSCEAELVYASNFSEAICGVYNKLSCTDMNNLQVRSVDGTVVSSFFDDFHRTLPDWRRVI